MKINFSNRFQIGIKGILKWFPLIKSQKRHKTIYDLFTNVCWLHIFVPIYNVNVWTTIDQSNKYDSFHFIYNEYEMNGDFSVT